MTASTAAAYSSLLDAGRWLGHREVEHEHERNGAGCLAVNARRAAIGLLVAQAAAMMVFSAVEYHRYDLTRDFAIYAQVWWAIAHGHLDPTSTVVGLPFWRSDAEFIMWPLSLFYFVDPHPLALLWLQDLAVVATELVTFRWLEGVIRSSSVGRRTATALASGAAVVLALNPWAWETIAFDFHPHVLAALFTVLAGYDLHAGRRRCWVWVSLALLCCSPAALYVVGLGAAGFITARSRRTRFYASGVALCGMTWLLVVAAIGAAGRGGHGVDSWYGYLVGPHARHIGPAAIFMGLLRRPEAALSMLSGRWGTAIGFLAVVGLVGVLSPWGYCLVAVVFLPAMLNADPVFFRYAASFQVWPALPFVLVGSVSVLARLLRKGTLRRLAVGVAAAWGSLAFVLSALYLATLPSAWIQVSPPAARELARIQATIPRGAEVIADNGIVGRFADRSDLRVPYLWPSPVDRRLVVFVFASGQGVDDPTAPQVTRAVARLERSGAVLTAHRAGISAVAWRPPPDVHSVTVP